MATAQANELESHRCTLDLTTSSTNPKTTISSLSQELNTNLASPSSPNQSNNLEEQSNNQQITNSSALDEPLFQIKKWNQIAFWKWDVHSDVCAICRVNVMNVCPTCQTENRTNDCVIVWGTCNHSFHNCCIVKWIKRNNRCPLCQQEWIECRKRQLY